MLHAFEVVDSPSEEPITLEEAQEHLHLVGQDDYVNALIKTARVSIENYLKRALITTTFKAYSNNWCDEFLLPFPKLQSVESVKYYDLNGVLRTLSASDYWVSTNGIPGKISWRQDVSLPEVQYMRPEAIEISYTAGYGDAEDVPEPIRHAMKLLIGDFYDHRGEIVVGSSANRIPSYITNLIHDYRVYEF